MSFVPQAERIVAVASMPNYRGAYWSIDKSGVGGGVVDMLTDIFKLPLRRVTLRRAETPVATKTAAITVPKVDLMAAVMASFAQKELRISPKLKDYVEVMKQLRAMQSQFTTGGAITWNAVSGQHDDYVTAIALAVCII